jgi:4,5-dihydroxyphthalate decarboxylase
MHLKCAFSYNPRVQPLVDGAVDIEGAECEWTRGSPASLHLRHLNDDACDVFEFSLSNLMITRDRPAERQRLRWLAIPIFLSKATMWLHLNIYVHVDSGIRSLADFKGKRIGIPDYQMTAAVWMRIVLRQLYGIEPQHIHWVNGRSSAHTHGQGVTDNLAPGIVVRRLQAHESLNHLLQRGEIDAAYGDNDSAAVSAGAGVRPLFGSGDATEIIAEFRQKTGITPVNHTLMMQERLVEQYPDLPMRLFRAFEQSKQEAYRRARQTAGGYLLFPEDHFSKATALFGEDPYPSGLAANRHMLKMLAEEVRLEGLVRELPDTEALFAQATRGT